MKNVDAIDGAFDTNGSKSEDSMMKNDEKEEGVDTNETDMASDTKE